MKKMQYRNNEGIKGIFTFAAYLCLFLSHKACNSLLVEQTKDISYVIKYILNEVQPYQVSVLTQDYGNEILRKNYLLNVNAIVEQLLITYPVLIIQPSRLNGTGGYLSERHPLLKNARYTTLFVSLLHVDFENQNSINLMKFHFKENLNFIISLSPSKIRPVCLFIVIIHKKISRKSINNLLNYAWKKKFLEVTIFQLLSGGKMCENNFFMNAFNPFTNTYLSTCFFNGITVFLNKLKKMNLYPFNVALIAQAPSVNFNRDSAGNLISINGTDFGRLIIAAEYLNFSINQISPNVTSYLEPFGDRGDTLLELIINGKIDYGANQLFMYLNRINFTMNKQSEHSEVIWLDEIIALVPIFSSSIWIQFNALFIIVGISAQVSLMYLIVKIFKFNSRYWRPHYIFQLLLGNTAPKLPRRSIEQLFFVLLFIMSHQYTTNWFAKLADQNLNDMDTGPYKTIYDIGDADITLEIDKSYENIIFYDQNKLLRTLYKKIVMVTDLVNCPARVLADHKKGCLIDKSVALASLTHSSHTAPPKMKILNYIFWTGPKGYILSEASPYVIEFSRINQLLSENGLWQKWRIDSLDNAMNQKFVLLFSETNSKIFDKFLGRKLIAIFMSGLIISCTAFSIELIIKHANVRYILDLLK